jgi:hypothetical protein
MTPRTARCKGSQGQWQATVTYNDGTQEILPCVHSFFWRAGRHFHDPWTPEWFTKTKFKKHVALIKEKMRVIVTDSDVDPRKVRIVGRGHGAIKRLGYKGIFTIENLVINEQGVSFDFAGSYARCV